MADETNVSRKLCAACGCRWRGQSDDCPECGTSVLATKKPRAKTRKAIAPIEFHPKKLLAVAIGLTGAGGLGYQFALFAFTGLDGLGKPMSTGGRVWASFLSLICAALIPLFITYAVRMFRR